MALPKERIQISLTEFLKATMAGGLLFLLPVALIAIVLKHVMQLAGKVVRPISNYLPVEAVIGVRGENCPCSTGADPRLVGRPARMLAGASCVGLRIPFWGVFLSTSW
jgi:hypothetical protein